MCSRFELMTDIARLIADSDLRAAPSDSNIQAFVPGEIRPTNFAPIIQPGHIVSVLPWGLSVSWQSQPVINARAETLDIKPTFKPLLNRRCLVPATAYFEWRKAGRSKIKTRIFLDEPLMFAGLIGARQFTIITCTPSPSIAHIHDRMPVILKSEGRNVWLDPANSFSTAREVLVPYDGTIKFDETRPPAPQQGELLL